MRIASIGELLWDVFPDREHLGGAPFNFAVHARRLGEEVAFVSAVGDDARGREALRLVETFGLPPEYLETAPEAATGMVRVQLDKQGQPEYEIVRPAAYDFLRIGEDLEERLRRFDADWVVFNTLYPYRPAGREQLEGLLSLSPRARRFYDVNLRPACYDAASVRWLLAEADVVKMNEDETRQVAAMLGQAPAGPSRFCEALAAEFGLEAVCVTRGGQGCGIWKSWVWTPVAGMEVAVADTVGAGDAFAAGFLHAYGRGWPMEQAGSFANRLGALVASRSGATPEWSLEELGSYPAGQEI